MRILRVRFLGVMLGVVTAACGGDGPTTPPPPPPPPPPPAPTITLAPASLSVEVGQSGTFTATINNGTGTITWTSSPPAVATVDQAGLVTGVTPGNATVTAVLTGQSGVSASAPVTVTAPVLGITVVGVTKNGQPVSLNALSGVVRVEVDVDAPANFSGAVEVVFDDVVVGSQAIVNGVPGGSGVLGERGSDFPLELAIRNRTILDVPTSSVVVDQQTLAASPRTPNGTYEAIARLIPTGGQAVSQQSLGQVTLANTRGVVITSHQVGGTTVQDPVLGTTWGTEASFTAADVRFDGSPAANVIGVTLESVEIVSGAPAIAAFGSSTGGVVSLILRKDTAPAAGGTQGVEAVYRPTGVTADGQSVDLLDVGGALTLANILFPLDNKGPEITGNPTFEVGSSTAWFNRTDPMIDRLGEFGWTVGNNVRDGGIGSISCSLTYTSDGSSFNGPVTTGDDIGTETSSPALRFRLNCLDGMGNLTQRFVTDGQGTTPQNVGMDFTKPKAWFDPSRNEVLGLVTGARNPAVGTPVFLGSSDINGSGFGLNPYRIMATRYAPGLTTVADQCFIGNPNGVCVPLDLSQNTFAWPDNRPGQIRVEYQAQDRARNLSNPVSLGVFYDTTAPLVQNVQAPNTFTAGQDFTAAFEVTDESEVAIVAGGFVFDNTPEVAVLRYSFGGTPFDDQFATSVPASYTLPFYSHIEALADAGGFYKPSGVGLAARSVIVGGTDFGGNVGENRVDLADKVAGSFASFNTGSGPENFRFSVPQVRVCYNALGANGNCGGVPEQVDLSLGYFVPSGGQNTIDNLLLTKLSTNAQGLKTALALTGVTMTLSGQNFGPFSEYRFSGTLRGSDFHSAGNYELGWYGYRTGGGTLLNGYNTRIPLEVVRATPIGW